MWQKRCADCVPFLLLRDRACAMCDILLISLCPLFNAERQSMCNAGQYVLGLFFFFTVKGKSMRNICSVAKCCLDRAPADEIGYNEVFSN